MTEYHDYPLHEVAKGAEKKMEEGWTVFQKFSCRSCGSRQTMGTPNQFFTKGTCQECGAVTDIRIQGCNYMATNLPEFVLKGMKK